MWAGLTGQWWADCWVYHWADLKAALWVELWAGLKAGLMAPLLVGCSAVQTVLLSVDHWAERTADRMARWSAAMMVAQWADSTDY